MIIGLAFCLKVPLDSLLVWASSEGSGETARMRRLAWTFAARIGDKQVCWYIFTSIKRFLVALELHNKHPRQTQALEVVVR